MRETHEEVAIDLDHSGALVGGLPDPEPTSRAIPRPVIAPWSKLKTASPSNVVGRYEIDGLGKAGGMGGRNLAFHG